MMIRINLLVAHRVRKEKEGDWLVKGITLGYVIFLLAALLGYWRFTDRVHHLKEEKEGLERQTQISAALQKEIQLLKEKKALTQTRLALLQNLEKDRQGPVPLMEHLSTSLPVNQLWLTTLKEIGPEIRIDGISFSNEILAEYIKRLESWPYIKQVDLIQSIQANYKNMKVKQFTLIAWTKFPPPPVPPVEKK
jgi:type IV pilus assembly protein PilN